MADIQEYKEKRLELDNHYKKNVGHLRINEEAEFDDKTPAGDDFMIWEPQNFKHKINALIQNWIEAFCLVGFALVCLLSPSFVAIVMFLIPLCLMYTMTMDLKVRFIAGFFVIVIQMGLILIVSGIKAYMLKDFKPKCATRKEFLDQLRPFIGWAYDVNYDRKLTMKNSTGPYVS